MGLNVTAVLKDYDPGNGNLHLHTSTRPATLRKFSTALKSIRRRLNFTEGPHYKEYLGKHILFLPIIFFFDTFRKAML